MTMPEKGEPTLLSITEAAKRLGVHVSTLRRWADQGAVATVRLPSGYRRFEAAVIDQKRREMGFRQGPETTGGQ